ncbi:MAG: hypothetical protein WC796_01865 [Candidatus Pacearchaeota archaeon]|jgi:hypothetical protein
MDSRKKPPALWILRRRGKRAIGKKVVYNEVYQPKTEKHTYWVLIVSPQTGFSTYETRLKRQARLENYIFTERSIAETASPENIEPHETSSEVIDDEIGDFERDLNNLREVFDGHSETLETPKLWYRLMRFQTCTKKPIDWVEVTSGIIGVELYHDPNLKGRTSGQISPGLRKYAEELLS